MEVSRGWSSSLPLMKPFIEDPVGGAGQLLGDIAPTEMTGVFLFNHNPFDAECMLRAQEKCLLVGGSVWVTGSLQLMASW